MFGLGIGLSTRAPRSAPGVTWAEPAAASLQVSTSLTASARIAQQIEAVLSTSATFAAEATGTGGFSTGFSSGFSGGVDSVSNRGFSTGFSSGFNSPNA